MTEVVTGTESVLDTPLPAAYTISIAQITWIYVLVLPFQLYGSLSWVSIPGSIGECFQAIHPFLLRLTNMSKLPRMSFLV